MTRSEMVVAAHRGLLIGPSPLLRHTPAGRQLEADGVVMRYWGPVGPDLNKAAVVSPSPPLARVVEVADAFFGPDSGGYGIVVEGDAGHPVEAELRAAGWRVFEDEAAMVLPVIPDPAPLPIGLVIERVRDAAGRRDLIRVLAAGFGAPTAERMPDLSPDAFDAFAPTVAAACAPDICLLVGYLDGHPAASAYVYTIGSVAGLTGVATVPAYRRRGLSTALTRAAVAEAAARGCSCAVLAALNPAPFETGSFRSGLSE